MTNVNAFFASASTLTANAVAFVDANRKADGASTPFARSVLASIVGGLATLPMVEAMIVAAMGSPVNEKGKAINTVSGLRDLDGGARLYQAWKDIAFIVANIEADKPMDYQNAKGETLLIGENAIHATVTDFILEHDGAVSALFGAKGLTATVKALMTAHAKAIAAHNEVEEATSGEGEGETDAGKGDDAPKSDNLPLADRLAATMVALRNADDAAFMGAADTIDAIVTFVQARLASIGDANVKLAA